MLTAMHNSSWPAVHCEHLSGNNLIEQPYFYGVLHFFQQLQGLV